MNFEKRSRINEKCCTYSTIVYKLVVIRFTGRIKKVTNFGLNQSPHLDPSVRYVVGRLLQINAPLSVWNSFLWSLPNKSMPKIKKTRQ